MSEIKKGKPVAETDGPFTECIFLSSNYTVRPSFPDLLAVGGGSGRDIPLSHSGPRDMAEGWEVLMLHCSILMKRSGKGLANSAKMLVE